MILVSMSPSEILGYICIGIAVCIGTALAALFVAGPAAGREG